MWYGGTETSTSLPLFQVTTTLSYEVTVVCKFKISFPVIAETCADNPDPPLLDWSNNKLSPTWYPSPTLMISNSSTEPVVTESTIVIWLITSFDSTIKSFPA